MKSVRSTRFKRTIGACQLRPVQRAPFVKENIYTSLANPIFSTYVTTTSCNDRRFLIEKRYTFVEFASSYENSLENFARYS